MFDYQQEVVIDNTEDQRYWIQDNIEVISILPSLWYFTDMVTYIAPVIKNTSTTY